VPAVLKFESTWSFPRASNVSSSIRAVVTASTVLRFRRFVVGNTDDKIERSWYGSKRRWQTTVVSEFHFVGYGRFLADGE